jgi:hypothetical protein
MDTGGGRPPSVTGIEPFSQVLTIALARRFGGGSGGGTLGVSPFCRCAVLSAASANILRKLSSGVLFWTTVSRSIPLSGLCKPKCLGSLAGALRRSPQECLL